MSWPAAEVGHSYSRSPSRRSTVAVVVVEEEEAQASIRSSSPAAEVFDSLGGIEGQVQLQGNGVEGSKGIRYWD